VAAATEARPLGVVEFADVALRVREHAVEQHDVPAAAIEALVGHRSAELLTGPLLAVERLVAGGLRLRLRPAPHVVVADHAPHLERAGVGPDLLPEVPLGLRAVAARLHAVHDRIAAGHDQVGGGFAPFRQRLHVGEARGEPLRALELGLHVDVGQVRDPERTARGRCFSSVGDDSAAVDCRSDDEARESGLHE